MKRPPESSTAMRFAVKQIQNCLVCNVRSTISLEIMEGDAGFCCAMKHAVVNNNLPAARLHVFNNFPGNTAKQLLFLYCGYLKLDCPELFKVSVPRKLAGTRPAWCSNAAIDL